MERFFAMNGSRTLLFYCERDQAEVKQNATTKPAIRLNKPRVSLTDGRDKSFAGLCVFFIRTTMRAITTANVGSEVCILIHQGCYLIL